MTSTARVQPIPTSYRRVTPAIVVKGAAEALDFYTELFQAKERTRFPGPGGSIAHAEIEIGDSIVMVEDESPYMGTQAPPAGGLPGSPCSLFIYVDDVDAVVARAAELGATIQRPPSDQFYGDRDGAIIDPFGHCWTIATHVEDVDAEEMGRRLAAWEGQQSQGEDA